MNDLRKYLEHICSDELSDIINNIGQVGIVISDIVRYLPIYKHDHPEILTCNTHGEIQTSLDIKSNILFREYLKCVTSIKSIVSEENDSIIINNKNGQYMVAYDPIDGSSNIDINIPIGSIFGIYNEDNKIVCSGYILYGSSTVFVLALGNKVSMFALNNSNEWILTQENIKIPIHGNTYSINEGNLKYWSYEIYQYIEKIKKSGKVSSRYVGSMVADIHRTLLKGGIFLYPADMKNSRGKLRQLYEVNPMSYIIEIAGGVSYSGLNKIRCLDVPIGNIHQNNTVCCFMSNFYWEYR